MAVVLLAIFLACCPIYRRAEPEVKATGVSGLCKSEKHAIVEAKYAASTNLRDACAAKDKDLDYNTIDYSREECTWYHDDETKNVSCSINAGAECMPRPKPKK